MAVAKIFTLMALALSIASCGPTIPGRAPDPIVDPITIKDPEKYTTDLAACRALSDQAGAVEGGAQGAAIGVTGGAIVGGLAGAVLGSPGAIATGAGLGAVSGGAAGGTAGAMMNYMRQRQVLTLCLIGRGYRPLG